MNERFKSYRTRPFPEILADLVRGGASGVLTAMGVEAHRGVVIVDGEIVAARSSREDERLGRFLVERNWLDEPERAQSLLSQAVANAPPLGEVLVSKGFLSTSELEGELQELALMIVRKASADTTAYAEFFENGGETHHLDTLAHLKPAQVLLTAARATSDIDAMKRRLGDGNRRVRPIPDLIRQIEDLELTTAEAFIISRTDAGPRLQDLIGIASMPPDEVIATLYTLSVAGLITIRDADSSEDHQSSEPDPGSALTPDQRAEREEIERLAEAAPRTDHYQALMIPRTATNDEVIEAWGRIRRRFAVSRTTEPHLADLGDRLKIIVERAHVAYDVLGNPRTRRRYDTVLAAVERERIRQNGETPPPEVDPVARAALVEANFKRADELIRDGDIYSALRMLEQACQMDPRPAGLLKLAQLQLKNPRWSAKALRTLQRALEADPRFVDAWIELAEYWKREGDAHQRRKALETILSISPDHPYAQADIIEVAKKTPLSRFASLFKKTK